MSPRVQLPLTTEHALLGLLQQRPMHGYEIHQHLSDPTGLGRVWRLKQSQLYALLVKLEEANLIVAEVEAQGVRPPRKVYQPTASGEAALRRWLATPVPHGRALRLEFLAKLFFARQQGADAARRLIEQQRAACQSWVASQDAPPPEGEDAFDWLVDQFRVGQIKAVLAWLDTCEGTLVLPA